MKLTQLFSDDILKSTIYGERFLNDTKGNFKDYSEVNEYYDPQGQITHVNLPYSFLPKDRCIVLQSHPSKELLEWVHVGNEYRFLWHPDVVRSDLDTNRTVRTQPTSSTRTLLTEHNPRIYIKTDLDKKHFRFVRRLKRSSVEHSISICTDLKNMSALLTDSNRYAFLAESLGLVVVGGDNEGSGVIFRETTPYPYVKDNRVLMPYHSLYANDPHYPKDRPLLVQLIELHASCDPLNYFVSEIVGPVIEAWVLLVSNRGLLPELHGQNALAEIDEHFHIRRVVHRDFQGTYSDTRIRTNLILPLLTKHVAGSESGTTIQSQYSHVFDGMIGRYLLSRLSKVFCIYFGIEHGKVSSAIRSYHHNLLSWREADFPKTTYRFESSASQQIGNNVQLVDTGKKPEFR